MIYTLEAIWNNKDNFYHRFLSFWKDFQNKNPSYLTVKLLQVRQCLHYKKGYFTGIRVKQTSSHQSRREVSNLLVYYFEKSDHSSLPSPSITRKKRDRKVQKKKWLLFVFWFIRQTCSFWTENDHWSTKN